MVLPQQSIPRSLPPAEDIATWKVALLHNARPKGVSNGQPDDLFEEFDSEETIGSIRDALRGLVAKVVPIEADRSLPRRLALGGFQFAFHRVPQARHPVLHNDVARAGLHRGYGRLVHYRGGYQ